MKTIIAEPYDMDAHLYDGYDEQALDAETEEALAKYLEAKHQVDTDKPTIVRNPDSNSPGAYTIPFDPTPTNVYINTKKCPVKFSRLMNEEALAKYLATKQIKENNETN